MVFLLLGMVVFMNVPIDLTLDGIVISLKLEQNLNIQYLREETHDGIVILHKFEHEEKQPFTREEHSLEWLILYNMNIHRNNNIH